MEEITITKSQINHSGMFNFGDFYKLLYSTMKNMGYVVIENQYKVKKTPEGDEIELNWDCYKVLDDYTRFRINIYIFIAGLQKVQVKLSNGATVKRDNGKIMINFSAFLQTDYLNRWETHPLLKFLKGIYDYYIYRKEFQDLTDRIIRDLSSIENEIKSFFQMAVYL